MCLTLALPSCRAFLQPCFSFLHLAFHNVSSYVCLLSFAPHCVTSSTRTRVVSILSPLPHPLALAQRQAQRRCSLDICGMERWRMDGQMDEWTDGWMKSASSAVRPKFESQLSGSQAWCSYWVYLIFSHSPTSSSETWRCRFLPFPL